MCECYHLTHFAILLSPKLEVSQPLSVTSNCVDLLHNNNFMQISKDDEFRLQIIGYVGVSISVVCMLITIVSLAALKYVNDRKCQS